MSAAAVSTAVQTSHVYLYTNPERTFHHVGGDDLDKMDVITEIFHRILTPLYGPQEKALSQIREGRDRTAYLLYECSRAVGVLVFKTVLSNEFAEFGVQDSIEVKSLFVDHSVHNSGRGLGSSLVDKLKREVNRLGLGHKGIHVTVSENKQESLMFFRKKGFEVVHEWKDRYVKGTTEYLLSCPERIAEAGGAAAAAVNQQMGALGQGGSASGNDEPELVHVIHDAHYGNIHALRKLSDGTFVSGSADNSIYKWDRSGRRVATITEVEPSQRTERDWITAVSVLNDAYWVSGQRNGQITLWKTSGERVREIKLKLPQTGHVCHAYNTYRALCFAGGLDPHKPSMFVGFPTAFDEYNFIEGRTESTTKTHVNDWVYCVHPLTKDRLLAVTGGSVDVWKRGGDGWQHGGNVLLEGQKTKVFQPGKRPRWQRAFISDLAPMQSSSHHFGLAVFDGSVKVLDISSQRIVASWKEHQKRVWSIVPTATHTFASSGEDRTIKLWDMRQPRSMHTISGHVGEVTTMLSLDENTLVAGTCPPDPFARGSKGAEIRFYDVRKCRGSR